MRILFIAFVVTSFIFCSSSPNSNVLITNNKISTDTLIKEIPLDYYGEYTPYYKKIKKISSDLTMNNLDNGFDSLEIRIWLPERAINRVLVIKRIKNSWEAYIHSYSEEYDRLEDLDKIFNVLKKKVDPRTDWRNFSQNLLKLRITSLPNMEAIAGKKGKGADGDIFCIEICTVEIYRFYSYNNPFDYQNIEQMGRMVKILNLLDYEFNLNLNKSN